VIEHLVFFKFKSDTSEDRKNHIQSELKNLKDRIPQIVDLSVGHNFSERAQGFDMGLTVRFKNKADLETYGAHPEHMVVVNELIKPAVDNVVAVDYEF
jgi:hypothetical protein